MKKKLLIIIPALILIIIGVLAVYTVNLFRDIPGRPAPRYVEAAVTSSVDINETMFSLLNTDFSKKMDISFKYEINAGEMGLVSDSVEAAASNSDVLNKAVNSAKKGTRILIPEGRYYIDGAINLFDKKDITISGNIKNDKEKVVLINVSYQPFEEKKSNNTANCFNINYCSNIKLENITIDYLSHTSADGIITEIKNGRTYFNVYPEFTDGDKLPLVGNEQISSVLTADDTVFIEEKWADGFIFLKQEDETDEFSIPMQIGKPGQRICCRFTTGPYISYVIHATKTSGFILENIECNSCPAGFIFSSESADLYFKGLNVSVPFDSSRLLGSNEDCMHLVNLSGELIVTDSNFSGIGDDALNIHSQMTVVSGINDKTVEFKSGRPDTPPSSAYIKDGESVEFFDKRYNSLGIADVKRVNGNKLTFDTIPTGVDVGCYIQNVSCAPDTLIKNCKVEFGRARGLLIQTKDAVISECIFKNMRLSGILMAPDFEYWYEAGFTDNVLIQNNTFENCASLANGFGVIHISTSHDSIDTAFSCYLGHKNISIFDNQFIDCRSKQLTALGIQNLKSDLYGSK